MNDNQPPLETPLYPLHLANKAKIVPFAGYAMPVNYSGGIIKEHQHTRNHAGLFDVSHMGQILVRGEDIAIHLESQIPVDLVGLAPGRQKYGLLINDQGGVLDDLMVINRGDHFMLVVNAACKHQDFALLNAKLGDKLEITLLEDRGLLALQGPAAFSVIEAAGQSLETMKFMDVRDMALHGCDCIVSRSGYTGEDGFEISLLAQQSVNLAEQFIAHTEVDLVGLGARDSLRLEAGLCLYGQDMNADITPVEAGLSWAISRPRRLDGNRPGGFPGADQILGQLVNGADKKLVGLLPEGRAPMRSGTLLFDSSQNQTGVITSGGFSPTLGRPISMGYVAKNLSEPGTQLLAEVRSKQLPLTVAPLPFVKHQYFR